jgi:WD40 repeat protein/tetratricopeptide (TPR) repeat protein
VAFTPQGGESATLAASNLVKTVNTRTWEESGAYAVEGIVRDLSYSRDGKWISVLSRKPDQLTVIDAEDGAVAMKHLLPRGGGMFFNNARISPDRSRVYVSGGAFDKPIVQCVSVRDGSVLWKYPIQAMDENDPKGKKDDGFSAMDLSPDGNRLAIATGYQDALVRIFDPEDGRLVSTLRGHTGYVLQLAFSEDGGVLASTSQDQTIRLWDTYTWTRISVPLRGHNLEVNAVTLSKRFNLAASGNKDGEVMLWDLKVPQPQRGAQKLQSEIQTFIPLPVNRMLLGQARDGKWSLIDMLTLAEEPLPASEISSDGRSPSFAPRNPKPSLTDAEKRLLGPNDKANASAVSPDGRLLVVASESGRIGFFEPANPPKFEFARSSLPSVFGLAFTRDGLRLAVTSGGVRGIAIWDTVTRQELITLSSDDVMLAEVHFTDDQSTLIVSQRGGKGTTQFWHAPSLREIEAAEREGGMWPQTGAPSPPESPPTLAEVKRRMEAVYVERIAEARSHASELPGRLDDALWNLAQLLRNQNRHAEAEPHFLEILQRLKQRTPENLPAVIEAAEDLLSVLIPRIGAELNQPGPGAPATHNKYADTLVAELLALHQRQAESSSQRSLELLKVAMLQLWFGNSSEQTALSRRMIEEAEQNTNDGDAMRLASAAWCLRPSTDSLLLQRAHQLASNALKMADSLWRETWSHEAVGLTCYRSGDYERAAEAFSRAIATADQIKGPERVYVPALKVSVKFIRSIIAMRTGDETGARRLFFEAKAAMTPLPADHRQIFESVSVVDTLRMWLACREAQTELRGILEASR